MAPAHRAGGFTRTGRASTLHAAQRIGARWRGQGLIAPCRNERGLWGYAPACCGRLCQSVPSPTLAVRRLVVTKDGSPTHRPALLWSFHAAPHP